jgi:hypothetical protein
MDKEKLLLPWKQVGVQYRRYFLDDEFYIYVEYSYSCGFISNIYDHRVYSFATSFEQVKDNVDCFLIENGYILIPEDKVETYRLLI